LAVSFEIHSDKGESRRFYSSRDFFCHFRLESAREFVRRQFDARQFTVRSHTKLAEVKFTKSCFGAFYFGKQFGRDGDSIRDARRKARRRWPVPCGKSGTPRQDANFGLA